MKPRFQLLLIQRAASRLRATPGRASDRGFFMAVVVLLLLGVVLGSVAIANRLGSGALRANLQGQSREARAVAENGVLVVVNELNKLENRRLLVTKVSNGWSDANTNPCVGSVDPPTPTPTPTPTALAYLSSMGTEILLPGDSARRYRVRMVEVLEADRSKFSSVEDGNPIDGDYNPAYIHLDDQGNVDVRYIRLTVEGLYYRSGAQVSSATVTREFQVVPKCCALSFGPLFNPVNGSRTSPGHGVDERNCDVAVGVDYVARSASGARLYGVD
jgi:hypothetical protein